MPHLWRAVLLITCLCGAGLATLEAQTAASVRQPRPAAHAATAPGLETITEAQLRAYLSFIASDALAGRATPSPGLDIAAQFLATLLSRWGLEPAGDAGSFFQTIALTRRRLDADDTRLAVGDRTLRLGEHYLPLTTTSGRAEGPLVYIGYGYVVKSKDIDPYAGLDVTGKVVVMHSGLPPGLSRRDLEGPRGEDWDEGAGAAKARGAVGILYLPTLQTLASWQERLHRVTDEGTVSVDAFASSMPALPAAFLAPAAFGLLFDSEAVSAEEMHRRVAAGDPARPFALSASKRVALHVATNDESATTRNVVAIWRGGDTSLRDEYVALGAHYDHVGTRETGEPGADRIYNGADDDGSGTVALLAMAEALSKAPRRPKRSTLFVWHAGEERGLWGARYFTDHPTVPLARIVAQLNIDMIGRSRAAGDTTPANARLTGPDSVYVIGSRLMSSDLGRLVDRVNDDFLGLTYDYGYADPKDPAQFFYRSDHYHYAKHGIPVAFFFSGVHEDYHGVDDEIDGIDFRKLQRVTQTVYATLWELATRGTRPAVDQPLGRELLTR